MKQTTPSFAAIFDEASKAAHTQAAKTLAECGHGGCGFAWVSIKPARGPFVSWLKANKIGHVDTYEGGYKIWDPSQTSTQSEYAKVEGARAFVSVLARYGIKATACSRAD